MGWKTSMVIIENKNGFKDDLAILKSIGKEDYQFKKEVSLDECVNPRDNSINIGYFNDNIIICDDYQITEIIFEKVPSLKKTEEEMKLSSLFPYSEIVFVACHSVVNYHAYSIIQNENKIRLKVISADTPRIEFGERIHEENLLYEKSYAKDGENFWKNQIDNDGDFTEDQLMEEFTFTIAERRLGIPIDDEELFGDVKFKKYIPPKRSILKSGKSNQIKKNNYLLTIILIVLTIIICKIIRVHFY